MRESKSGAPRLIWVCASETQTRQLFTACPLLENLDSRLCERIIDSPLVNLVNSLPANSVRARTRAHPHTNACTHAHAFCGLLNGNLLCSAIDTLLKFPQRDAFLAYTEYTKGSVITASPKF